MYYKGFLVGLQYLTTIKGKKRLIKTQIRQIIRVDKEIAHATIAHTLAPRLHRHIRWLTETVAHN